MGDAVCIVAPAPLRTPQSKALELAKVYNAGPSTLEKIAQQQELPIAQPKEQPLELGGVNIRRDTYGRYCLNDLHQAAGGLPKDSPGQYFKLDGTQVFCMALAKCSDVNITPFHTKKGNGGGTYVIRELVYHYAMWISPEFSIKVIRAYDQLATQGIAVHENHVDRFRDDPMKMLEVLASYQNISSEFPRGVLTVRAGDSPRCPPRRCIGRRAGAFPLT